MMLRLLPGDMVRITELENGNRALSRTTVLLITSSTTLEGETVNITGAGFYVEFQSALTTTGQGDPGFMLTFDPNFSKYAPGK